MPSCEPDLIQVTPTLFLRVLDRRSQDSVDYVVQNAQGRYLGLLRIQDGRLTSSAGVDPSEYLAVQRVLPGVDFSLWGQPQSRGGQG